MKVVTAVVNNPIFIEIQYYTLKKYFQGIMNLLYSMTQRTSQTLQMETTLILKQIYKIFVIN